MTAYYFRVVDEDKQPTGYIGFAMAPDLISLFWEIDQYVDPYSVQIKTANFASYCKHVSIENSILEESKFEFSQDEPINDQLQWKEPNWPSLERV